MFTTIILFIIRTFVHQIRNIFANPLYSFLYFFEIQKYNAKKTGKKGSYYKDMDKIASYKDIDYIGFSLCDSFK